MKRTLRWSPFCGVTEFRREKLVGLFDFLTGRRRLLPAAFGSLDKLAGRPALARELVMEGFLIAGSPRRAAALSQARYPVAKDFAPPAVPIRKNSMRRLAVPDPSSALGRRLQATGASDPAAWAAEGLALLNRLSSVRGFLDDDETLCLYFLARTIPPRGDIVELGSFLGRSTAALALGGLRRRQVAVHAVDLWPGPADARPDYRLFRELGLHSRGPTRPAFKANMRKLGLSRIVVPHRLDTREAAARWKAPVALLFIDSSHQYENARRELALAKKLARGGLLIFDDFSPAHPGVMWAAREHLARGGYDEIGRLGKLLWARRAA